MWDDSVCMGEQRERKQISCDEVCGCLSLCCVSCRVLCCRFLFLGGHSIGPWRDWSRWSVCINNVTCVSVGIRTVCVCGCGCLVPARTYDCQTRSIMILWSLMDPALAEAYHNDPIVDTQISCTNLWFKDSFVDVSYVYVALWSHIATKGPPSPVQSLMIWTRMLSFGED